MTSNNRIPRNPKVPVTCHCHLEASSAKAGNAEAGVSNPWVLGRNSITKKCQRRSPTTRRVNPQGTRPQDDHDDDDRHMKKDHQSDDTRTTKSTRTSRERCSPMYRWKGANTKDPRSLRLCIPTGARNYGRRILSECTRRNLKESKLDCRVEG